jgi:hypothetical protein
VALKLDLQEIFFCNGSKRSIFAQLLQSSLMISGLSYKTTFKSEL